MSNASRRIVPITATCLSLLAATGCRPSASDHAATEPPVQPISVRVATATLVERPDRIEAGGVIAAGASAAVSSRVAAPISEVAVRAGDRVRAGDVLVRLEAREMTARVAQATAAGRAAEEAVRAARSAQVAAAAERALAAAWHGRISALRQSNAATAQEFDEADARLAAAAARDAATQAEVEQAAAQLAAVRAGTDVATITESYAIIRAPFDGEITERLIDPGNLAVPGQPLLLIDAAGPRRVDVRVDEARAAYIRPGDRAAVVLDDGGSGAETAVEGRVIEIARAVAADQRAFTVKVALPASVSLRTGAFARVLFDGARGRALVVPSTAVRVQGQLRSVFVVSGGAVHVRFVQTGPAAEDGTEIVAGLEAGEIVVDAPPAQLRDAQPVLTAVTPADRTSP
jgi:RND family efflux transporter MFP subunit